jgi:D-sedoheptulose 7-phosphate isomerase
MVMDMRQAISELLQESSALKAKVAADATICGAIESASTKLLEVLSAGGTIYSCGNGGSACDALHLTEELVARYKRERPGYRAMHFLDPGTVTCWANDYEFADVFARQARTFCSAKDVLIAITTSGNSENILRAITAAREKGCYVVALLGKDGGKAKTIADSAIVIPHTATERIQEVHITIIHIFCEMIERALLKV